jgi:hypothetical protein
VKISLLDDAPLRRRVVAIQLGLLAALLLSLAGQGVDLPVTVGTQLPVIAAVVGFALLIEHALRAHPPQQRHGLASGLTWASDMPAVGDQGRTADGESSRPSRS